MRTLWTQKISVPRYFELLSGPRFPVPPLKLRKAEAGVGVIAL